MNDQADLLRVVRQWIDKAENDLRNAEHTLTMEEGCPFDTVCFHAQQCVEKYLKAQLTYLSIDFPKIHDVGELIRLLPPHLQPAISVADQERLTDYVVEARYPGDWEPITRAEAEEMVTLARKVRQAVRSQLPGEVTGS